MKKLVLMLAVAFSMSFVACNKEANTEAAAEEAAPVEAAVEDAAVVAVDTTAADTVVSAAAEIVEAPAAE